MGGFFGVASAGNAVRDLYFGTDYHSHLGTVRGGMAVKSGRRYTRFIHDITNAQFRSKFDPDIRRMKGQWGIGIISDGDDQPLLVESHLGPYAIVTVGAIQNLKALVRNGFRNRSTHFLEMSGSRLNSTEVVATLINAGGTFAEGIRQAQEAIVGSCSLLLLTQEGVYAARDRFGRTPVALGQRKDPAGWAAASEVSAFPNLEYVPVRELGPGEIVRFTHDGVETLRPPDEALQICAFLWIYYGYPSSTYEGVNVEEARYRCGEALARNDGAEVDLVAGIPDSGTSHAIGYALQSHIPLKRPFVKYTPTWPRSFMPPDQGIRQMVARMKLIPIPELIAGQRILFCEDSIVRGTQLGAIVRRVFKYGAREVHMRPACPPLVYGCKFLNFSRSRSETELAARRAMKAIEGKDSRHPERYLDPASNAYADMVGHICRDLELTSLKYQRIEDMVQAIGLPKRKLCTYCWDGCEGCK
ncbi:MAG: Amidophosphoribosyltransferase precursor [Lentisphaerae bacterium ADurb.BinA184]|nr:MAG: Amidophosphoribosyltransferase precursor [Lentisphaerae bacterium ADurb.BinA184]